MNHQNWYRVKVSARPKKDPNAVSITPEWAQNITPLKWEEIPGNTVQDKRQAIEAEISTILRESPNLLADASGATHDKPMGIGFSPYMQQAWRRLQQLQLALKESANNKNSDDTGLRQLAQEVLRVFNGDWRSVIQAALSQGGYEYHPAITDLFGGRSNTGQIGRMLDITNETGIGPNDKDKWQNQQIKAVQAYRSNRIRDIEGSISESMRLWPAKYPSLQLSMTEIAHLLRGRPPKVAGSPPGSLEAKITGPVQQQELNNLLTEIKSITAEVNNANSSALGMIWSQDKDKFQEKSGIDQDISFFGDANKITISEVLNSLGVTFSNYPGDPGDVFNNESVPYRNIPNDKLDENQLQEKMDGIRNNALDPMNIEVLGEYLLKGGYDDPEKPLGHIFRSDAKPEDFNDFTDQVLHHLWSATCRKDTKLFLEAVAQTGVLSDPDKQLKNNRQQPDEIFTENFGLAFDSNQEKICVETLRRSFGLSVVPYPLAIPKIKGCNINNGGFIIDFLMPSDVLSNWVTGPDGLPHPVIEETVTFIGEYYGYDKDAFKSMISVPKYDPVKFPHEGYTLPNGEIAQISDGKGGTVPATNGTPMSGGERYGIRSEWKKVLEDYFATATGNRAISISRPIKEAQIMSQLDAQSIIYHYKGSGAPCATGICGAAYFQIISHLKECKWAECPAHRYRAESGPENGAGVRQYTPAQTFVRAAIADLKVQRGLMPILHHAESTEAEDGGWLNQQHVWEHYSQKQAMAEALQNTWQKYVAAYQAKNPEAQKFLIEYRQLNKRISDFSQSHISKTTEAHKKHMDNDADFQCRMKGMTDLLTKVDQPDQGGLNDKQVKEICDTYVRPWKWGKNTRNLQPPCPIQTTASARWYKANIRTGENK